ncbi:hypothetical protein L9F63_011146, partial [Diploptera punctata]
SALRHFAQTLSLHVSLFNYFLLSKLFMLFSMGYRGIFTRQSDEHGARERRASVTSRYPVQFIYENSSYVFYEEILFTLRMEDRVELTIFLKVA